MIIKEKTDKFAVSIEAVGFDEAGEEKIKIAAKHMCEALSSVAFRHFCKNYSYTQITGWWWWKKYRLVQNFRWSNGMLPLGVYYNLLEGAEKHSPEKDGEADIFLKLDYRYVGRVLGYTYANSIWQWVYNWFFRKGTEAAIAGNIAHEWCHKMGYNHEYRRVRNRDKTVPYAVGYFVRDYVIGRNKGL
jgi:hypothetical protein